MQNLNTQTTKLDRGIKIGYLKKFEGITKNDRVCNDEIREQLGIACFERHKKAAADVVWTLDMVKKNMINKNNIADQEHKVMAKLY